MNRWIETALLENRNLLEHEAWNLLSEYGLPVLDYQLVHSAQQAVQAAEQIGYPVVLKVVSLDIIHKSDVGGVKVGLSSGKEVMDAYHHILKNVSSAVPTARVEGILVCSMLRQGLECIVGMTQDPSFGPAIMFGVGGIFVEVMQDVSFRVLPLGQADAFEMIRELKNAPLLFGVRGQPPKDVEAIVDFLLKIARLIEQNPEIDELDINPCFVYEKGVIPADVRVLLKKVQP